MAYPSSRNQQITILITVTAIAVVIGAVTLNSVVLNSVTNVKGVDVKIYWNSDRAEEVSTIDWGVMEPATTKSVTFYILNTGDSNIVLSINTTSWSPAAASDCIMLTWDYKGQRISPSQMLKTTLTLTISPIVQEITSFKFDIIVTGIA